MLEQRVLRTLRETIADVGDIDMDANLETDLGLDSFGTLMVINDIEDAFNITIEEELVFKIRTVREIVSVLRDTYGIEA